MALRRKDVPRPLRRMEAVQVDSLGGELIVKALTLTDRMRLGQQKEEDRLPFVLSVTVFDADDQPWHTMEEWSIWGGDHPEDVMKLELAAARISGLIAEDVKKN